MSVATGKGINGYRQVALAGFVARLAQMQWLYLIALSSLLIISFWSLPVGRSSMTGWDSLLPGQASSASSLVAEVGPAITSWSAVDGVYTILSSGLAFMKCWHSLLLLSCPIGLYTWLSNRVNEQDKEEPSHFEAKKFRAWQYLSQSIWPYFFLIWIGMGFAYKSIHQSPSAFHDRWADATNGIGQLLMTGLYPRAVDFLVATNLFSIYLWWGSSNLRPGHVLGHNHPQ